MARRKTGNKKVEAKKNRAASGEESIHHVQADDHSIAFEELHIGGDVGGDIRIGHTIGYTADQVSVLLKQITTTLQPKPFDGHCPYKGLEVFEEEDAELFFGRERLVTELVGRVKESRTVFITGPSGSGKSSLVRAGLIHDLKQGVIKSSERWLYETMKPGREPLKDLALAFSRLKSPELEDYFRAHADEADILNKCVESVLSGRKDQRFVLFVDQFEEIFTQINSEEERVAFINMLAHAGTVENGRVIVLFAMRSDFVSNCATYPALNELLSQEFRQIGAMQPEELVSAIALPARHVGLPVEHELIAQIINDMRGEPDALPLMQFALKDLFDAKQAEGGVVALTLKDYLGHGGIHKSLERHADATFAKLNEHEQELTRSIFSGLIEIGRGRQDTKRTALFDELVPANTKAEDVEAIVQKLADARLIITDEQAGKDTVTISHEKLIEAWPWLKKLVDENRDVINLQNEIRNDAKEWDDHKRDVSYLYSGARLVNASEQLKTNKLVLSGTAFEYIRAGQARQQRNRTSLIAAISAIIGLLLLGVIVFSSQSKNYANIAGTAQAASTFAISQQGTAQAITTIAVAQEQLAYAYSERAQEETNIARAGELAAQSVVLRENNFPLSLLLGVEAYIAHDTIQTRSAVIDNLQTNPQLLAYLRGNKDNIVRYAFHPSGKMLVLGRDDNTLMLWDLETKQPIGQPLTGHTALITSVTFSPNGRIIASGSQDGVIFLWDTKTGKPIGLPRNDHTGYVNSLAFSPDGNWLASISCSEENKDNFCNDGEFIVWDKQTGGQLINQQQSGYKSFVDFRPDGKTLIVSSLFGAITLWDLEIRKPIGQPLDFHTVFFALSPDGKTAASASDKTILLWDLETGQSIGQPLSEHSEIIIAIAFGPDGKTLVSGDANGSIILWDLKTRQLTAMLQTGELQIYSVAFSPDGKKLVSSGRVNSILLWRLSDSNGGASVIDSLSDQSSSITNVTFSPDGNILISSTDDGSVILWDVSNAENTPQEVSQPIGKPLGRHPPIGYGLSFSPDGKKLASCSLDGTIILWNVETVQPIGKPLNGCEYSVAFSPDGRKLASGSLDGTIILWNAETVQPIGSPLVTHTKRIRSIAFSPDGKKLASGSGDGTIIVWDVEKTQPTGQTLSGHRDSVTSMVFNGDGKILVSGSDDGAIILWDTKTGQPISQPSQTAETSSAWDPVFSIAMSPDGKTLAWGNYFGKVILWDVQTRQPIGQPLFVQTRDIISVANFSSVAFSPDGKTLVSGSDGGILLWDVETGQLIGQPLYWHSEKFTFGIAYSPDGKTIASGAGDGTIILWNVNPLSWIELSCQRVGRNFTRAEWAQYFPNEEYRKTCDQ